MKEELIRMWYETVLAKFETLYRHMPGGTEEDNENCTNQPRFKPGNFRV
jgi:hypothetical protein